MSIFASANWYEDFIDPEEFLKKSWNNILRWDIISDEHLLKEIEQDDYYIKKAIYILYKIFDIEDIKGHKEKFTEYVALLEVMLMTQNLLKQGYISEADLV